MRNRILSRGLLTALGATSLLVLGACTTADSATTTAETTTEGTTEATTSETTSAESTAETTNASQGEVLSATLNDAEDTELGNVEVKELNDALEITVSVSDLEPGFYGFHIHGAGLCETDSAAPDDPENTGDFLSAGGHLGADESDHPDHAGDLPQLLVQESGDGALSFQTDRLTLADLRDEDGAAFMIHDGPDNYANIPERYASDGADGETRNAGDAGSRLACGVVGD
jgi:superoxide dismutase, Cu-Zn family